MTKVQSALKPGASYWLNIAKADINEIHKAADNLREQPLSIAVMNEGLEAIAGTAVGVLARIDEHERNAVAAVQYKLVEAAKKAERLLIHLTGTQEMPPASEYVSKVRREILDLLVEIEGVQ